MVTSETRLLTFRKEKNKEIYGDFALLLLVSEELGIRSLALGLIKKSTIYWK